MDMPAPAFADMIKKDLADLQKLRERTLPVKVGRYCPDPIT